VGRIERFSSRADADLARTVLQDAGIPAYVSGDDAGGLHPEIPYGIGGTAVIVPDDRYAEAISVLDGELGEADLSDGELEAAAMAAAPADPSVVGLGTSVGATPSVGTASTIRSGGRRPVFVGVVGVMLIAVLVAALLVTLAVLFDWRA
jgi:hypothetical protein